MLSRSLIFLSLLVSPAAAQQVDSARVQVWAEIFTRARKAQQAHDERLAKVLYDSVIALDPRNSMAYFMRGMAHYNLSDTAAARSDLRRSEALGNPMATAFLTGPQSSMLSSPPAPGTSDKLKRAGELNAAGMARLASGDTTGAMTDLKKAADLGNEGAGFMHQSLEAQLMKDEARRRVPMERSQPESSYPVRTELILLLAIVVILSIPLALWVRLTPQGMVSDDEVAPGETVLWSGAPRQGYYLTPILASSVVFGVVVFGMLFLGFQFRLARVIEHRDPFDILLLVYAAGVWSMVGRYFKAVRKRKQTTYILTDKRALITRGSFIIEHKLAALGSISATSHRDGTTSLSSSSTELFEHVPDGGLLKKMIHDAHRKAAVGEHAGMVSGASGRRAPG